LALASAIRLCERVCPSAVQVHVYVAWLARGDSTVLSPMVQCIAGDSSVYCWR
jgi:hypothetical protein